MATADQLSHTQTFPPRKKILYETLKMMVHMILTHPLVETNYSRTMASSVLPFLLYAGTQNT